MSISTPGFRDRLRSLYFGDSLAATRFRYGLVFFDIATILLFLLTSFVHDQDWIAPLDLMFAVVIFVELTARIYADDGWKRALFSLATAADLVVLASLILPAFIENLGFLRVARALRLLRSYHLLRDLRRRSSWFRLNEDVIQRTVNLAVFIFVVTSAVYVSQHRSNPAITNYVDALYFTITTLTTTGFGDIVLEGNVGRILAVVIMVVGVGLFLRLLQAIFKPHKVRFECNDCGLMVHDIDAVHCKHCGKVLAIRDEGFGEAPSR